MLKKYTEFIYENELLKILSENYDILEYFDESEMNDLIGEGLFNGLKKKLMNIKSLKDPIKRQAAKEQIKNKMSDIKDKVWKQKEKMTSEIEKIKDNFNKMRKQQLG